MLALIYECISLPNRSDILILEESIIINIKDIQFSPKHNILTLKSVSESLPEVNQSDVLQKIRTITKEQSGIDTLNIIPTNVCLGKCVYCYASENRDKEIFLTVDKLKKSLDCLACKNQLGVSNIRFYGGEPLLNLQIDELLLLLFASYKDLTRIYISSGLLFSDDHFETILLKLSKLPKELISLITIGVSLDFGSIPFTRLNDFNITKDVLLNRIHKLLDIGIKTRLVTIINKFTDVNKMYDEILETSNQFEFDSSDLNTKVAHRLSVAVDNNFYPSIEQLQDVRFQFLNRSTINDILTLNVFPYSDVLFAPTIYKLMDDIYYFKFHPYYCGYGNTMKTINALGQIVHCHMNPFDVKLEDVNHIKPTCSKCDWLLICRGGCINRFKYVGENSKAAESYCEWIKMSFELALYRIYANMNFDKEVLRKTLNELSLSTKVLDLQ